MIAPTIQIEVWQHALKARAVRDHTPTRHFEQEREFSTAGEPCTPVRIGVDRDDVIAPKLLSIRFRADAIDALTAIGEAAASSAAALIQGADCAGHSDESG